jgi:hypothetical protein
MCWRTRIHARDTTTFTAWQFVGPPNKIAKAIFFFVFLILFRVCLVSMLRINRVTLRHFEFHVAAMNLLQQTKELLNINRFE